MKRTVHKVTEQPIEASPITKKGSIVFATIHKISDMDNPTIEYIETLTPDAEEAIKVLSFLDNMNGIGWTSELKRIERELREALHDLMSVEEPTLVQEDL